MPLCLIHGIQYRRSVSQLIVILPRFVYNLRLQQ